MTVSFPHEVIGVCPVCKTASVRIGAMSYYCENSAGAEKSCAFRLAKEICSALIPVSEARQLIDKGRTGLIKDFYSKHGNPFSAFLVLMIGKVEFEFPPEPKSKKNKKNHKSQRGGGHMTSEIARSKAINRFRGPSVSRLSQIVNRDREP
jgi:hypothetical protein